jgi:hypothetical protein
MSARGSTRFHCVLQVAGPEGWLRPDPRYGDLDFVVEFRCVRIRSID